MVSKNSGVDRKANDLTFLYDISQALIDTGNNTEQINKIIRKTVEYIGLSCCILTIFRSNSADIVYQTSFGIQETELDKINEKVKPEIIERVIKTGLPFVLPKISNEPRFLKVSKDLTDFRYEISLICIPIKAFDEVIGTISLSYEFYESDDYLKEHRLVSIICCMIGSMVRSVRDTTEELNRLRTENSYLQHELSNRIITDGVIGVSSEIQSVFELVGKVAKTNATVLILGESGVGKEVFANLIHRNSDRADKSFVKVNCAALPETLIESELFGHEKGSFTGADQLRKGRFELADGGTIFLDEIGDLPLNTQVKILRILQEREFERLGGSKTIKVDVRIITATNRNLEDDIKKRQFREDLYFRLNVFPVFIPPLRERRNDIPIFVNHFIAKFNKKHNLDVRRISTSALDLLMIYHWPGNVRELENCIERAAILSLDGVIHSTTLPPTLQTAESSNTVIEGKLDDILAKLEKQIILDNLVLTRGCVSDTSHKLGISERILRLRLEKYDLDPKRFKHMSINSNHTGY